MTLPMDTENLIALATEEDASPCNANRNAVKPGLSKRSKYGALTAVLLLVGLGLAAIAARQKAPLLQSSTDFIEESQEDDMLDAVNKERKSNGLSALCYNMKLNEAAAGHSQDMASRERMSHTGSDGSSMSQRVTRAGYDWNGVAENVANGQRSVSSVMAAWMKSTGHRDNVLGSKYTHFGYAEQDSYWTQVFARSSSESCSKASGGGGTCDFPTTYGDHTVPGCTKEGHDEAWCYTTKGGGDWKPCTAADNACSFPFTYKGTEYWECTGKDHDSDWCYTTKGGTHWKQC